MQIARPRNIKSYERFLDELSSLEPDSIHVGADFYALRNWASTTGLSSVGQLSLFGYAVYYDVMAQSKKSKYREELATRYHNAYDRDRQDHRDELLAASVLSAARLRVYALELEFANSEVLLIGSDGQPMDGDQQEELMTYCNDYNIDEPLLPSALRHHLSIDLDEVNRYIYKGMDL